MFKKVIFILLMNSCFVSSLMAQKSLGKQLTDAKFEVIKAAIEFLATDKDTFPKAEGKPCTDCKGYDNLITFINKNNLTNAGAFINEWRRIKLDTSTLKAQSKFKAFTDKVRTTITTGVRKSQRKNLPAYSAFVNKLENIQKEVRYPKNQPETGRDIEIGTELKNGDDVRLKSGDKLDTANEQTLVKSADVLDSNVVPENEILGFPIVYYAIAEAVTIIFLVILFILKIKAKNLEIQELNSKYRKQKLIKKDAENAEVLISSLQQELRISESKNQDLESLLEKAKAPPIAEPLTSELPVNREQDFVAPPIIESPVKYARYADAGDGFSAADLLTEENSETIFELTLINPITAEYRVSKNMAAQRYALANANYFLSKSCRYDTSPSGTIVTDVPGTLTLKGNKWQINEPAKISFASSL